MGIDFIDNSLLHKASRLATVSTGPSLWWILQRASLTARQSFCKVESTTVFVLHQVSRLISFSYPHSGFGSTAAGRAVTRQQAAAQPSRFSQSAFEELLLDIQEKLCKEVGDVAFSGHHP